jgi:hypothetical protein
MLIEVLLVIALPLLGTLRKVADGEPLDLKFGNDSGLEMIVLSLGGLAGAAHNPRLMANWGAETPTWLSLCFLADLGLASCLFYLRKFEPSRSSRDVWRDAAIGGLGILVLLALILSGRLRWKSSSCLR